MLWEELTSGGEKGGLNWGVFESGVGGKKGGMNVSGVGVGVGDEIGGVNLSGAGVEHWDEDISGGGDGRGSDCGDG